MRQTTAFRITAGLSVIFTGAAVALLGLTFLLTEAELTARSDGIVLSVMHRLTDLPRAQLPSAIDKMLVNSASRFTYYALVSRDGRRLAGNVALPTMRQTGRPFELAAGEAAPVPLRALIEQLPDGSWIEVARDNSQVISLRQRIFWIMAYSGLVVILAALLAGALLSRGPLRRVAQFRAVATRIAVGELALRMPVTARGDELDLTAGMVNAMLDEIERLIEQVKGATDAIAHDLRTPLARLRQRLQALARQHDDNPRHQFAPTVADAIVDVDHVLRRFNALLRISELEASGRQAQFAPVDPMALLANLAELYEPLTEERSISLTLHGNYGLVVFGDETLLLEAISNLIENALKFVGDSGHIVLTAQAGIDGAVIELRDDGPGIPEAERASVLKKFHRGSAAGRIAGTGLGLSLVAAIVHLHGFTMMLEDAAPGLIVRIECPRAESLQ